MFGLYDIRMPTALMQKAGARQGVAGRLRHGPARRRRRRAVRGAGRARAARLRGRDAGCRCSASSSSSSSSLGLGLPFLFLAAFSGRIAALPRAGAWMEGVKKVFGWILLAMAAYFLRTALPGRFSARGCCRPCSSSARSRCSSLHTTLKLGVRAAVAVLFLAAALFFAPMGRAEAQGPAWAAYDAGDGSPPADSPPSSTSPRRGACPASSSTRRRSPIPACARRCRAAASTRPT